MVVVVVDEKLGATGVGARRREGDRAADVPIRLLYVGLVAQRAVRVPGALARHVATEPELHKVARKHAEKGAAVEEAVVNQLQEAARGERTLLLAHRHEERAQLLDAF